MVVFHHIPGTGGVAVMANIALCNSELRILRRDAVFRTSSAERYSEDLCDLLHGHFPYENIPPGCVRFTFARHPIARLSSSFYSLRQVLRNFGITRIKEVQAPAVDIAFAGGARVRFQREQLFFMDRIEDFIDAFLHTQGTFNLGLIPDILAPDYTKHYDFIGVTERMNESIVELGKLVRTDASRMTIVNASNSSPIKYRLKELEEFYGEAIETYNKIR